MAWIPKTEYFFPPDDEKKVFNLILKNTINKEIVWTMRPAMLSGQMGNDKILFYHGETRTSISIQNKKEFAFFIINKEQEELLKKVISGKSIREIEQPENVAANLWSGKKFFELSKAGNELKQNNLEIGVDFANGSDYTVETIHSL